MAQPTSHSQKVDILSTAAMENAYYICHNVQVRLAGLTLPQDLMYFRGYRYKVNGGTKKKGRRK